MAPSEEPVLSRSIRFDWQVVQVGKDSIRLILNKARGVVFEDGKELEEVNENYFENLEKAHTAYEKNSSREMTLYSNKYLSWVKQVRDEGELQALAGGEIDGEMVSLVEFLDRMQL
jgi:magnesium-transporting ATPase (P-type)